MEVLNLKEMEVVEGGVGKYSNSKFLVMALLLTMAITGWYSCKKNINEDIDQEKVIKDENTIAALKNAYSYEDFDIIASKTQIDQIIQSASKNSKSFNEISSQLNLNNLRLFINGKEGITVVIFPFLKSKDKSFALKGLFYNGSFIVSNEIFVEKINIENKIYTVVSKDDEFFVVNTENGIDKVNNFDVKKLNLIDIKSQLKRNLISNININKLGYFDDQYGNHGGNGLCQRERNESFSDCYKAEMDELCDSFWGCVGTATPHAAVLVAIVCSCSARQAD